MPEYINYVLHNTPLPPNFNDLVAGTIATQEAQGNALAHVPLDGCMVVSLNSFIK